MTVEPKPFAPPPEKYEPVPYRHHYLNEEEQFENSRRYLEVMQRRRTVRDYSDEPVPFELIENAIRAASLAPNGANNQPWTFVVVSDPELKSRIREAAEAEERDTYGRRMSPEWRAALAHLGTDEHKPHIEKAPYVIVVFEKPYELMIDEHGNEIKVKNYYVRESVGIAVGFLLAGLTHAGLATLTHTPNPMRFLGEVLGRPPSERAFVLIPVGYPAEDATVPTITKKPLDEVMVHFEGA